MLDAIPTAAGVSTTTRARGRTPLVVGQGRLGATDTAGPPQLDAIPSTRLDTTEPDLSHTARDSAPCGRIWTVCYTHPQAERWANQSLQQRGYTTYLPLVTIRRRDNAIRSLWHRIEAPAFPRYLFVVLDGPWTPLRYCPGVADLVWQEPGKPGVITSAAVEALRSALQAAERIRRQDGPEDTYRPGAPCEAILRGGGKVAGVIVSANGTNAVVAAILFGELREIVVSLSNLRLQVEE